MTVLAKGQVGVKGPLLRAKGHLMAAAAPPLAPPEFTIALREQRALFLSNAQHFREILAEVREAIITIGKVTTNFGIVESRVDKLAGSLVYVGHAIGYDKELEAKYPDNSNYWFHLLDGERLSTGPDGKVQGTDA